LRFVERRRGTTGGDQLPWPARTGLRVRVPSPLGSSVRPTNATRVTTCGWRRFLFCTSQLTKTCGNGSWQRIDGPSVSPCEGEQRLGLYRNYFSTLLIPAVSRFVADTQVTGRVIGRIVITMIDFFAVSLSHAALFFHITARFIT